MRPRKPERFEEVARALGADVIRRTQHSDGMQRPVGGDLFLLDTLGELRRAYALADVAIVGRSFCPLFGSDMTEPIALGKPTIIGPNTADFADMMDRLRAGDGIVQVDMDHLADAVQALLKTERGGCLGGAGA